MDDTIKYSDLVIILSNLFDNAIDAAVKSKEKKICLRIKNIKCIDMKMEYKYENDVKRGK